MSTIGNVSLLSPTSATSTTTKSAAQTLTQQDFLKLMVAQFTQQDPLASGGDGGGGDSGTSSYITQLMGMTNLTTLQNVSSQQGLQLAESLQGATVTLSSNNQTISGVVQKTSVDASGGIDVMVNGNTYSSSDVTSINQTPAQTAATAAAAASAATTPAGS